MKPIGSRTRAGLLFGASTLALAALSTPSHAEQQLIFFYQENDEISYQGSVTDLDFGNITDVTLSDLGTSTSSAGPSQLADADGGVSGSSIGTNGGSVSGSAAADALDALGGLDLQGVSSFGGLTVTRDMQATHGYDDRTTSITSAYVGQGVPNAVRFVDTFTNNTMSTVSGNLAFVGATEDVGTTVWLTPSAGSTYLLQTNAPDPEYPAPVMAYIWGNNDYARTQVTAEYDNAKAGFGFLLPLEVEAGETKRIAIIAVASASLAFDPNDQEDDIAFARALADKITNNGNPLPINTPFFTGYTAEELLTLINWDFTAAALPTETTKSLSAIGNAVPQQIASSILGELANMRLHGDTSAAGYAALSGMPLASTPRSQTARKIMSFAERTSGLAAGERAGNWSANGWRAFAIASGFDGSRDGISGGAAGIQYDGFSVTLGLDRLISEKTRLGTALSYANASSDVSGNLGNSDMDAYSLSAYLSHNFTPHLYLDGVAMIGWNDYSYNRVQGPAIAHGETDGLSYGINLVTGFDVPVAANSKMGPYLSLSYMASEMDGYSETGAGIANLTVDDTSLHSGAIEAGMKASHRIVTRWGAIVPEARLGVKGNIGSDTSSVNAQFVNTPTSATSTSFRNGQGTVMTTGLGIAADLSERLEMKLSYNGAYGRDSENNTLALRAIWTF